MDESASVIRRGSHRWAFIAPPLFPAQIMSAVRKEKEYKEDNSFSIWYC